MIRQVLVVRRRDFLKALQAARETRETNHRFRG